MMVNRRSRLGRRRGLSLADVVVLVVVLGAFVLLLLMGVSRGRNRLAWSDAARTWPRLGSPLALYDQMHGHLPEIGPLGPPDDAAEPQSPGPLKILLETLQLPDLTVLRDRATRPDLARAGSRRDPVPGFICCERPERPGRAVPAPISYRAATGDNLLGDNGAFAVGPGLSLAAIEARDGLSYTSAFSERLVGDDQPGHAAPINYAVLPSPLPSGGCPRISDPAAWHGDAGSSWIAAGYRSTLYNHALPPNGQPSCMAADGRSAYMGASSGHVAGVNLLLLDGAVSTIRPSINHKVWRDYASKCK